MTEQGAGGGGPRGHEGGTPAVPDEVWARFAHDTERAIARSAPREPSARERVSGGARAEPRADAPGSAGSGSDASGSNGCGTDGSLSTDPPHAAPSHADPPDADRSDADRSGTARSGAPGRGHARPDGPGTMSARRSDGVGGSGWDAGEVSGSGGDPAEAVGELWQPEERRAGPAWRDLDARARRRRIARLLGAAGAVVLLWTVASHAPVGPRDGYEPGEATVKQSEDAPRRVPATPGPAPAVSPTHATPVRHVG